MANEIRTSRKYAMPISTIDYVHDEVHRGKLWITTIKSSNIADTSTSNILLITSTKEVHWIPILDATGPLQIKFYEGTVHGTTAGQITPYNLNRNFDTSAEMRMCKHNSALADAGSDGTLLYDGLLIGSTGGGVGVGARGSIGGQARANAEWVLKPDTTYQIRFINDSKTNINFFLQSEFYEEG